MALASGSRLGAYEIVGLIGAGGMGEVYRAVDVRLDRHVALKILPDAVGADPERTARFQREAKVLASLSHPQIAALFGFEEEDVRIYDLGTGRETRVTSDGTVLPYADWIHEERAVAFSTTRAGRCGSVNVWIQYLDGSDRSDQLTDLDGEVHVDALAPRGRTLAAHRHPALGAGSSGLKNILMIPVADGTGPTLNTFATSSFTQAAPVSATRELLAGPYNERNPELSADGRFIAYESDESGRTQIYVRPFPEIDRNVWQISARGGVHDLFYEAPDGSIMAAAMLGSGSNAGWTAPTKLFSSAHYRGQPGRTFDVAPDGRFLMIKDEGEAEEPPFHFVAVLNWAQELKRLVPTN
jgi:Tol biopolymer transport system component